MTPSAPWLPRPSFDFAGFSVVKQSPPWPCPLFLPPASFLLRFGPPSLASLFDRYSPSSARTSYVPVPFFLYRWCRFQYNDRLVVLCISCLFPLFMRLIFFVFQPFLVGRLFRLRSTARPHRFFFCRVCVDLKGKFLFFLFLLLTKLASVPPVSAVVHAFGPGRARVYFFTVFFLLFWHQGLSLLSVQ